MIPISLADLFTAAKATWSSTPASSEALTRRIDAVSTDTRELRPGSLFIGLPGPRFNGADFANAALEAGASAVLVETSGSADPGELEQLALLSERFVAPIAVCSDARAALGAIGQLVRRTSTAKAVAITGSCGKTSTKSIVAHMLRADCAQPETTVVASPKSFNNYIGVPRTLMLAEPSTEFMVIEVGTNGPGEIRDLAAIGEPNVALITTIGRAHLEGLGSVEGVADEKGALVASLDPSLDGSAAVLNADCPMLPRLLAHVPTGVDVLTFGVGAGGQSASVLADAVKATARGTEFQLSIDPALTPGREITDRHVVVPLLGDHAAANVAASLAVVLALGGDLDAALDSIATLDAEPHRLQPTLAGGVLVIDDAYNANPQSMAAAIRTLIGLERATAPAASSAQGLSQRVLVAGAMGEMGDGRLALHREVGGMAGASGIDRLILAGEHYDHDALVAMGEGAVASGMAPGKVQLCRSVSSAIAALTAPDTGLASGDICLVKASRAARLERVVEALAGHFSQDEMSMGNPAVADSPAPRRPERPGAHT